MLVTLLCDFKLHIILLLFIAIHYNLLKLLDLIYIIALNPGLKSICFNQVLSNNCDNIIYFDKVHIPSNLKR